MISLTGNQREVVKLKPLVDGTFSDSRGTRYPRSGITEGIAYPEMSIYQGESLRESQGITGRRFEGEGAPLRSRGSLPTGAPHSIDRNQMGWIFAIAVGVAVALIIYEQRKRKRRRRAYRNDVELSAQLRKDIRNSKAVDDDLE